MTKAKKIVCLALVICMACMSVFAQGAAEAAPAKKTSFNVGICQLVQHVALDAASQGFMDAIKEEMGDAVTFNYQNASGDMSTVATIINGFVSDNVDLILANATPALQTAMAATDTIPLLGTSITNYATALDMEMDKTTGINISGTSDLAPLDAQAAMIVELFPNVQNVGLLYCSAEANSVFQIERMEEYLDALNVKHARYAFTDSNDIASVTAAACEKCDVIYVPTDNTAASSTETIRNVVEPAKVPVIAGEEGICSGCGIATLSISYYDLGLATGKQAVQILRDGADVSKMEIGYAANPEKKYNAELCASYGIAAPAGYVAI